MKNPEPMTVRDLFNAIAKLPFDTLVVVSRDAEGNGFNPVFGIDSGSFVQHRPGPYYRGGGDVVVTEADRKELELAGYDKEFIDGMIYKGDDAVPCVIIWPAD